MTEQEWRTCDDPQKMLDHVKGKVSNRKLRLFAVSCCRNIWWLLVDEPIRNAVDFVEEYADGKRSAEETDQMIDSIASATVEHLYNSRYPEHAAAEAVGALLDTDDPWMNAKATAFDASDAVARALGYPIWDAEGVERIADEESRRQSNLARCILGNPFRSVAAEASWLTTTVDRLAQTIYDDRAFDRMPILADALEEAGCTNADVLAHCRSTDPHVRGCWVVDVLLGKE